MTTKDLSKFLNDQLSRWPLACENYRALKNVEVKTMEIGGLVVSVQFNPARIKSSAAKIDKASIGARKCFLCAENRPSEQARMKFEGRKGKKYDILTNPYPIFPEHFVIAADRHVKQSIWKRYVDMLDLSKAFNGYIFFYNGPECGASAPDHFHFQAEERGMLPLEKDVDSYLDLSGKSYMRDEKCGPLEYVSSIQDADLFHYDKFVRGIFVIKAKTAKSSAKMFYRLLDCASSQESGAEPMFNLFSFYSKGEYRSIIIFRSLHRPHNYFSDGPDHLTVSPGCADMAGLVITPLKEDFDKLDSAMLSGVLSEVSVSEEREAGIIYRLTRTQPLLNVGIMSGKEIEFEIFSDGAGKRKASLREGKIEYDGTLYDELYFGANTLSTMFAESTFLLHGVTIGKNFHWEREEDQKFAGALKIIVEKDVLTAVNVIGIEDYLVSVISSEMKSTASLEFLKAHAVISRSWVMAQIAGHCKEKPVPYLKKLNSVPGVVTFVGGCGSSPAGKSMGKSAGCSAGNFSLCGKSADEEVVHIKWYDHQDHKEYDVCADDHCQRYQGLTRATGGRVRRAVDETWGEVLTFEGEICDARFSKCCGGMTEKFSVCWEDKDYPYLRALPDTLQHRQFPADLSVSVEDKMPDGAKPFCDTADREVLSQVLNDYDLETRDFYRWKVEYGRDELSELIERRSGLGLGRIMLLEPLERGASGRICRLRIVGSLSSAVVGKELEIRRILSESHLKSSAFDVEYLDASGNPVVPQDCRDIEAESEKTAGVKPDFCKIVLHGRGWGHGVGLCQTGAAVMASQGCGYRSILEHYYPGAVISQPDEFSARGGCLS